MNAAPHEGSLPRAPGRGRWALEKVGTPVLTGVLTGVFVALFGILAAPRIADSFSGPSCDDPGELVVLADLSASGDSLPPDEFPEKGRVTYEPANLIDGNTSTAWVEGLDGLGVGAAVRIDFDEPHDVRMVCVVNGYAESWELYSKNSRIRQLETRTEAGVRTSLLRDSGTRDAPANFQAAQVADGTTDFIELTIRSAYAAQAPSLGSTGYADSAMSEVEVWVAPK